MRDAPAPLYMDAVIQPNRSLSTRGMWVVLGILALFNLYIAVFLVLIGAYPVPIFLGLDMVGVVIAFRVYRRRASRAERVRVGADQITVSREGARGSALVWSSPTAFTRVRFEGPSEGAIGHDRRLSLHLSNRSIAIGQALGEDERARLAARLREAIRDALAERHLQA